MATINAFIALRIRPKAQPPIIPGEDMTLWPMSQTFVVSALPAIDSADPYFLAFDVTRILQNDAITATSSLRFIGPDGERLGHLRTQSNRIIIGGTFTPGRPLTFNAYWGRANVTQPGEGFPSATTMLSPMRLLLLFENSNPFDYAPNPATFTKVGSPTFVPGLNGQAMRCGPGNYVQTTATKLRGGSRTSRHAMVMMYLANAGDQGRAICWANWTNDQRAFQLFTHPSGTEFYIDHDGVSPFTRWTNQTAPRNGHNFIGCSWTGGSVYAIVQSNDTVEEIARDDPNSPLPTAIFDSPQPYIVGGTPVSGFYHAGDIESVFEFTSALTRDQMRAWRFAWEDNAALFGVDRTPDPFDVSHMGNQERNTEVGFPAVQITGISSGTAIGIAGQGNPTFAIGSSASAIGDVRAKGTADALIDSGQWVRVWHTTSASYSTSVVSTLTIGTASSERRSTTKAEPGTGGGSGIPEGPATYTVNSLSALLNIWNTQLAPGQILEIAAGDYGAQGDFDLRNKDFSGQQPPVIRASTRGYRGMLSAQGGLFVSGESKFTTGSGGAEFRYGYIRGVKNVVFDGLRFYRGPVGQSLHVVDIIGSTDLLFQYCKFCGYKPASSIPEYNPNFGVVDHPDEFKHDWRPYVGSAKPFPNEWDLVPRGVQAGLVSACARVRFYRCMAHYGYMMLRAASCPDFVVEECMITDNGADHIRNDGVQSGFKLIKSVLYRLFPQQGTGNDVWHPDAVQNTAIDQHGAVGHLYDMNIVSVGDSLHAKLQGFFIESDKFPTFNACIGNTVTNNLMFATSTNTIYIRPARQSLIENNTILADMYAGRPPGFPKPPDSSLAIIVDVTTEAPRWYSDGSNTIRRNVHHGNVAQRGDTVTQNVTLARADYAANLTNYAQSGSTPVRIANPYTGVIDTAALGRLAPKTTSAAHPTVAGYPIGCSPLFQYYGVLP